MSSPARSPGDAKAIVVDATGKTVAELKPGAYQLQLPGGKYKASAGAESQEQDSRAVRARHRQRRLRLNERPKREPPTIPGQAAPRLA